MEKDASAELKKTLADCVARLEGSLAKTFVFEDFLEKTLTGVAYERSYLVLRPGELKSRYGCDGAEIGLSLQTLFDEHGERFEGYVFEDDQHLRIKVTHWRFGELVKHLQSAQDQLRAAQATEFAGAYNADNKKLLPKALSKAGEAVSLSSIPNLKEKAQAEHERKQKEQELLKSLEPQQLAQDTGEAEEVKKDEESLEEEEEEEEEEQHVPLLPSQVQSAAKAKKKGKEKKGGKTGGRGKAGKAVSRSSQPGNSKPGKGGDGLRLTTCSKTVSDEQSVASGSTQAPSTYSVGPDGKRQAPRERLLQKAKDWPVTNFLEGQPLGNKLWQARCTYTVVLD